MKRSLPGGFANRRSGVEWRYRFLGSRGLASRPFRGKQRLPLHHDRVVVVVVGVVVFVGVVVVGDVVVVVAVSGEDAFVIADVDRVLR